MLNNKSKRARVNILLPGGKRKTNRKLPRLHEAFTSRCMQDNKTEPGRTLCLYILFSDLRGHVGWPNVKSHIISVAMEVASGCFGTASSTNVGDISDIPTFFRKVLPQSSLIYASAPSYDGNY